MIWIVRVAALSVFALDVYACSENPSELDGGGSDAMGDVVSADASADAGPSSDASNGLRIMAFFGNAQKANASYATVVASGVVTGPVIVVNWNSMDDGGALDWTTLDGPTSVLSSYLTQFPTEKVSLLFEPASDVVKNTATPLDVLASAGQQICFCSTYAGDYPDGSPPTCAPNGKWNGQPDYTGLPVPYTGAFAARWQGFIAQAIVHLNASSYRGSLLYVTFGVSNGGEDIPRCGTAQTALIDGGLAGLSSVWIANLDGQDTAIENAKPTFPIVGGTSCFGAFVPPDASTASDNCDIFADLEAKTHASHGIGLRITTLQNADILAYQANTPTVSDWAAMNAKYPNVPIVWQTAAESAPVAGSDPQCNKTGSLAALVPFVMQHSSPATPLRVLEAYYADLEGTYVPGFHDTCWPQGTVTTNPYATYDTVFRAALAQ